MKTKRFWAYSCSCLFWFWVGIALGNLTLYDVLVQYTIDHVSHPSIDVAFYVKDKGYMQNDSKRPGCAGHITYIKDITYYHQSAKKCHKQGNLLLLHLQQIGKTFGEETLPKILIFYRIPWDRVRGRVDDYVFSWLIQKNNIFTWLGTYLAVCLSSLFEYHTIYLPQLFILYNVKALILICLA